MNYMSCLSRWRILIRKALSPVEKTAPATATAEPVSEQDEDEKLLNEMEELTNAMDRKKKRAKKVLAKKRAKVCSSSSFVFFYAEMRRALGLCSVIIQLI